MDQSSDHSDLQPEASFGSGAGGASSTDLSLWNVIRPVRLPIFGGDQHMPWKLVLLREPLLRLPRIGNWKWHDKAEVQPDQNIDDLVKAAWLRGRKCFEWNPSNTCCFKRHISPQTRLWFNTSTFPAYFLSCKIDSEDKNNYLASGSPKVCSASLLSIYVSTLIFCEVQPSSTRYSCLQWAI